jgi:hypothetical protein
MHVELFQRRALSLCGDRTKTYLSGRRSQKRLPFERKEKIMEWSSRMAKSEEIRMKEEFLEQYRKSVEEEQYLLVEMQELKNDILQSGTADGMPKGSKQSDLADLLMRRDKQLEKLTSKLCTEKFKQLRIRETIGTLKDAAEKETLKNIYIYALTFDEMMEKTGKTRGTLSGLKKKALRELKVNENDLKEVLG